MTQSRISIGCSAVTVDDDVIDRALIRWAESRFPGCKISVVRDESDACGDIPPTWGNLEEESHVA